MFSILKKLTYRPVVRKLVGALNLDGIARKLYWLWAKPSNNILTVKVAGITGKFYVHTPSELRLLESLIYKERRSLEKIISILRPGDVVYDVGASVGLYSILLAKAIGQNGEVIAFEPENESFQRLQENLKLNGLRNIRPFQKALGERSEQAKLYAGEDGKWCSLVSPPATRTDIDSQVVEVVAGDQFREAENLPIPRIIKIDVEGYEYAVLQGLRAAISQPVCEVVCVEAHPALLPPGIKTESLVELLRAVGFSRISTHPCNGEYQIFAYKTAEGSQLLKDTAKSC